MSAPPGPRWWAAKGRQGVPVVFSASRGAENLHRQAWPLDAPGGMHFHSYHPEIGGFLTRKAPLSGGFCA